MATRPICLIISQPGSKSPTTQFGPSGCQSTLLIIPTHAEVATSTPAAEFEAGDCQAPHAAGGVRALEGDGEAPRHWPLAPGWLQGQARSISGGAAAQSASGHARPLRYRTASFATLAASSSAQQSPQYHNPFSGSIPGCTAAADVAALPHASQRGRADMSVLRRLALRAAALWIFAWASPLCAPLMPARPLAAPASAVVLVGQSSAMGGN